MEIKTERSLRESVRKIWSTDILKGDSSAKVGMDRIGYEEVLGTFRYRSRNREGIVAIRSEWKKWSDNLKQ